MNNRNIGGEIVYWFFALIFTFTLPPLGIIMIIKRIYDYYQDYSRTQNRNRYYGNTNSVNRVYDGKTGRVVDRPANSATTSGNRTGTYYPNGNTGKTSGTYNAKSNTANPSSSANTSFASRVSSKDADQFSKRGKALTVLGIILLVIFGIASLGTISSYSWVGILYALRQAMVPLGLTGAGAVLTYWGIKRKNRGKRFRRIQTLIGHKESVSIHALAEAVGVPYKVMCEDLEKMIDEGFIPVGFVDTANDVLVLTQKNIDEVIKYASRKAETAKPDETTEAMTLREIREVNDRIADPELTRKISRIEEITGKIFEYIDKHPNQAHDLRTFLNYYLPTTLKILNSYAQLAEQNVEGENISATMERIEGMMDKVVEGFEKQLDKLFQDKAMDISSDIDVLENMLQKDGLTEDFRPYEDITKVSDDTGDDDDSITGTSKVEMTDKDSGITLKL